MSKTLESGDSFEISSASATAVRIKLGKRWGLLTGFLDMLKVAVPMLVARALGEPIGVEVAIAAGGLLGHVLPVYHRFRGGRGESPTYGAVFALDPIGVLVSLVCGTVAGFLGGHVLVLRETPLLFLAAWAWFVRGEPLVAAFAILATVVYQVATFPEYRQLAALMKKGVSPSNEEIARELAMGGRLGRLLDEWSVPGIVRRARARA